MGWELTTFAIAERRHAQALFLAVRRGIALQQRHRVGHLSGYFIHMWFGVEGDPTGLPYRRTDREAVDQLVESLIAFRPDPDHLTLDGDELPAQVTNFAPVHGPGDVTYFSVPLLGAAPSSPLFALTGTDLGLAFQSQHLAHDEW